MKTLQTLIIGFLSLAVSSTVFGSLVANNDTTYDWVPGANGPAGFSGWITLDSPSGSWPAPRPSDVSANDLGPAGNPIIDFDFQTPDGQVASWDPDVSATVTDVIWNSHTITLLDISFTVSDPFSGEINAFDFDVNKANGVPILDPGSFATSDNCPTWLLLAGGVAALGTRQLLSRRELKLC